ncbi:hypothetical protein NC653_037628 [Populus alba x Populus x berolinensis]|uniref:Uncharacterized protein n=1 Tax=Populus alba x Populus x berolinensis TaxID=444605 RepID=A0AAD6LEQ5_9ROSI|nr:hypothetical protein NC653_037628 [Populus alba x Populus x berolinensis]
MSYRPFFVSHFHSRPISASSSLTLSILLPPSHVSALKLASIMDVISRNTVNNHFFFLHHAR